MLLDSKSIENKIIFISGTPCTGKTTLAIELNNFLNRNGLNSKLIKINDLAIENDLVLGEDPDKFYKIIDIEKLNIVLNEEIIKFNENDVNDIKTDIEKDINSNESNGVDKILIVEGHLSHLCEGADKVIVLRLNPNLLKERLSLRNYSKSKINENLEAEALAVCSAESYDIHGNKTNEIDASYKSINELVNLVVEIILDKSEFPVGLIDFMDWFLINS